MNTRWANIITSLVPVRSTDRVSGLVVRMNRVAWDGVKFPAGNFWVHLPLFMTFHAVFQMSVLAIVLVFSHVLRTVC